MEDAHTRAGLAAVTADQLDAHAGQRGEVAAHRLRQPALGQRLPTPRPGVLDEQDLWSDPQRAQQVVQERLDELTVALQSMPFDIVVVTSDPSWVRMPDDPAERLFVDLLSHVNQRVSAVSPRVHAIVAGRVLDLSSAPVLRA